MVPKSPPPKPHPWSELGRATLGDEVAVAKARTKLFGSSKAPTFGRYEVVERAGRGGMGTVYVAFDPELERHVAIKLPHEGANLDRFRREARALARLGRSNVVGVYEVLETSKGPCIVMELVKGETLEAWLGRAPRRWNLVLARFVDAGLGLHAIHKAGLVHRDFKPANVMVTDDGRVVVMDLGLALDPSAEGSISAAAPPNSGPAPDNITRTGTILGTPAYMAPEQAAGAPVTAAADQWAFCLALWESLAGARPDGASLEHPPGNSTPAWLFEVLRRGLDAEPAARWPSMMTLVEALRDDPSKRRRRRILLVSAFLVTAASLAIWLGLRRAHAQQTTALCTDQSEDLADQWTTVHRARSATAFSNTGSPTATSSWAATETLATAYIRAWSRTAKETCIAARRDHTIDDENYQQTARCLEVGRRTMLQQFEMWSQADTSSLPKAARAMAMLPSPERCTDTQELSLTPTPPPTDAHDRIWEVRANVAALRTRLRLHHDADQTIDDAEALLTEAESLGWLPLAAEAKHTLALVLRDNGDYDRAQEVAEQAYLHALASGHDLEAFRIARVAAELSGKKLGEFEEAQHWLDLAEAQLVRLGLRGTIHEAELASAAGSLARAQGANDRAIDQHKRAMKLHTQSVGADNYLVSVDRLNLANALASRERFPEARGEYLAVLEMRRNMLGPDHPSLFFVLANLATVYNKLGEVGRANQAYKQALSLGERSFGPNHPRLVIPLLNLASSVSADRDYGQAEALYRRAMELARKAHGEGHLSVSSARVGLANIHLANGRTDEAIAGFSGAIVHLIESPGPQHPATATARTGLGRAYLAGGDAANARIELEHAKRILETSEAGPSAMAGVQRNLAIALWETGDRTLALDLAHEAQQYYESEAAVGLEQDRDKLRDWMDSALPPDLE